MIVILTLAAILTGAGVVFWSNFQPKPTPMSGSSSGAAAKQSASEAEQQQHRERFFGGDTERDIRSGQEMKPRW
ncbi:entry exclusion protein TrbK [Rhizobium sp. CG5]|uniref:entry exclusion protein TrbK n=1 Tax=Rhizobium sp. CG5 TaxID=2726076 RepID=UPI00254DAECD|nr:entry exclusion protein TrbK [Rhizobium sp. CG5]